MSPNLIKLDLGCGFNKQEDFIGMDRRPVEGIDIVHDIEDLPWPLEDNCCKLILCSHLLEHLNPKYLVDIINEAWRVLAPDGKLVIAVPYAGSFGAYQDPTHVRPGFNEACVTSDTEVLTSEGFKSIIEISSKDEVLSLDPATNLSEYISNCRLVSYNHDGPMIHFKGRSVDLITNENHRMWYAPRIQNKSGRWRFIEASELLNSDPYRDCFSQEVNFEGSELVWKNPDFSVSGSGRRSKGSEFYDPSVFSEFLGWYLSEGSVAVKEPEICEGKRKNGHYFVFISQKNFKNRARIAEIITQLGYKPQLSNPDSIFFSAFGLSQSLKEFGHSHEKYIPKRLFKASRKERSLLFQSLMAGDGHWGSGSQWIYCSTSKKLADDVQILALSLNYRASMGSPRKLGACFNGKYHSDKTLWTVHGSKYRSITPKKYEKIDNYQGTVHSLIMPYNHIYMARRNGKCIWTGNTFLYFDPNHPLWGIYRPKPFYMEDQHYDRLTNLTARLRAIKVGSKDITEEELKNYGVL